MMPWATHVTLGAGHVPFYDDPPACAEAIRRRAAGSMSRPGPEQARGQAATA